MATIHPEDRDSYQQLKKNLALKYKNDRSAYSIVKTVFVNDIEAKAGYDGVRICKAYTQNEWAEITRYHQKYSTSDKKIYKLANNESNTHFILLNKTTIIGYAHLLHSQNKDFTINMFEVDKKYKGSKEEDYFSSSLKRWVYLNMYKIL